jgi:hypothetical protein
VTGFSVGVLIKLVPHISRRALIDLQAGRSRPHPRNEKFLKEVARHQKTEKFNGRFIQNTAQVIFFVGRYVLDAQVEPVQQFLGRSKFSQSILRYFCFG